jgi:4-amino-4-deoxy-L-arabinose transferase-like glycosyltransferase
MTTLDQAAPSARRSWPRIRVAVARPELLGLLALTALLNLWALGRNGWANDYYSATVRSMSSSWHNFLYASFDQAGVMTVDKPPLALWVQSLSVRVFGFHSLSVLVPQALMGMVTVGLVYDLVRRRFGRLAGFVGGLALAVTPITVAISRHNNPDALLVLCCTAALWFFVRGLEDGRMRWLVLAGVAVGLGFETKMLVAFMVVPGMVVAWLWVRPRAWRALLAGGAAMLAVSAAWPLLVALTPASDRPWISGTSDNSVWSLIFGYNGFGRIDGQAGGPQAFGGGGPFGGSSGPFRLFNVSLAGQASWLIGFALVAGIAVLVASRLRRADARTGWLIAVGGAFLTTAVAFSFANGIFHPYYVSLLAPFTAALVGAGVAQLRGMPMVAPLAIAAGVMAELLVLHRYPGHLTWLPAVLIAGALVAIAAIAFLGTARVRSIALGAVLALLFVAPSAWAVQTLGHSTSGTFPTGGPADVSMGGFGGPGGGPGGGRGFRAMPRLQGGFTPPGAGGTRSFRGAPGAGGGPFGGQSFTQAIAYARAHGGGTIGVSSQQGASQDIISSNADVAGLGGFSGRESQVSVSWLAGAVRSGKIRWVVTSGGGMGGPGADGRVGSTKVMAAVASTCKSTTVSGLYDCAGQAGALASR